MIEFLLKEIIPLAESETGCKVTTDPERRIMIGMSSGGICAFNVAWHLPDELVHKELYWPLDSKD